MSALSLAGVTRGEAFQVRPWMQSPRPLEMCPAIVSLRVWVSQPDAVCGPERIAVRHCAGHPPLICGEHCDLEGRIGDSHRWPGEAVRAALGESSGPVVGGGSFEEHRGRSERCRRVDRLMDQGGAQAPALQVGRTDSGLSTKTSTRRSGASSHECDSWTWPARPPCSSSATSEIGL